MLTEATLANIQRVELRDVWPSEPSDFTPWLADNISELGAALGMELELRQREADVMTGWSNACSTSRAYSTVTFG